MNDKLKQLSLSSLQIHYYAILFFCFCLPVWSVGTVMAIITLMVNAVFCGALLKNRSKLLHPIPLFSIGIYLVYLIGLAYTTDLSDGLRDVETKLSLLLFPLLFFTGPKLKPKQKERALLFFILGCLGAILVGMTQLWYYTIYLKIYLTAKFANLTGVHSSYLCLYLGVGIFFLAQQLLIKKENDLSKKRRLIYGSLILVFIIAILNLYAKMGTYVLILLLTIFYLGYQFKKQNYTKGMLQTVVGLCLVFGLTKVIPAANYALYDKIDIPKITVSEETPPDVRLEIWKSSLMTIKEKLFIGHGTGDVHVELIKRYKLNDFKLGVASNFNPHNQYLQTTIALGLVGLFFLIGTFFVAIIFAWREQHYFYLFFVLLFAMCCLTESMLEMEKGVLFFCFFNSFFAIDLLKEDSR